METTRATPPRTRYGFHYFPDVHHYRENDLRTWLPELRNLGASWLTVEAPLDYAIPEHFLRALVSEGIQPILHLPLPTLRPPAPADLGLLFRTYARWGVRYVALFDRPNMRRNWSSSSWSQSNLVERFLDIFIPRAEAALAVGLTPIFPPLEPGGDYWDTAFLQSALQGLLRRGAAQLLERLVLGAYAFQGDHPLSWGAGGPERWPQTRPYSVQPGSEDQRGFRLFDWYLAISQAVLGQPRPLIVLAGGSGVTAQPDGQSLPAALDTHAANNLEIVQMLAGQAPGSDPIPDELIACNFWLLSCTPYSPHASQAWFPFRHNPLPAADSLKQWVNETFPSRPSEAQPPQPAELPAQPQPQVVSAPRQIPHYLLLPSLDWGATEKYLENIRPFVNRYHPTIGFSPKEAARAQRVTVVGSSSAIPDEIILALKAAGCQVDRVSGDGISIASQLAAL